MGCVVSKKTVGCVVSWSHGPRATDRLRILGDTWPILGMDIVTSFQTWGCSGSAYHLGKSGQSSSLLDRGSRCPFLGSDLSLERSSSSKVWCFTLGCSADFDLRVEGVRQGGSKEPQVLKKVVFFCFLSWLLGGIVLAYCSIRSHQ